MGETLAQRADRLHPCTCTMQPEWLAILGHDPWCQSRSRPAILADLEAVRAEAMAEHRDILDRADRALMNTGMGETEPTEEVVQAVAKAIRASYPMNSYLFTARAAIAAYREARAKAGWNEIKGTMER